MVLVELRVSASSAAQIETSAPTWNAALAPGGRLYLSVSNEAMLNQAKLPLLLHDFVLRLEDSTSTVLCAAKPDWGAGAKVPIKKPLDDVVDEDDLLAADGLEPPVVPADVGCSARKPCAGCTCGRADALAAGTPDVPPPSGSSNCGNCHKGDAFRCGSCPHLGKPAFKPGEETLVLEMTDDL